MRFIKNGPAIYIYLNAIITFRTREGKETPSLKSLMLKHGCLLLPIASVVFFQLLSNNV